MIRKFLHRGRRAAMAVALTAVFSAANAAPVTLNFSADFGLNLNQAMGGTTVGQLIDTTYGAGTGTGSTVAVSGSLTYDPATAVHQQVQAGSQATANYLSPITGASLGFWNTTFAGNVGGIASTTPYFMQTDVSGAGGCLGTYNLCSGTATGNAALMINDSQVTVTDINGHQTFASRDSASFVLGFTTTATDLVSAALPSIYSDANGNQFLLWGMSLYVVGNPDEDLWNSAALPGTADFFDPAHLDYVSVALDMIGLPNGDLSRAFPVRWNGNVSDFSVVGIDPPTPPAGVPEPGSLALMLTSGSLLAVLRRKHDGKAQHRHAPPTV